MRATRVSMTERTVNGVPVVMTEFGYKTFSMVAKSIGWFTGRTSPTYLRTDGVMETRYGQPRVSLDYPLTSAEHIMDLYQENGVMSYDTVVLGPGLETCCYLGAALNAPVLPSQFIASAPDRTFVDHNVNPRCHTVVGYEADWPELCLWLKPRDLGALYDRMLDQAKNVIMVSGHSGHDNKHGTPRGWRRGPVSLLGTSEGGEGFRLRLQEPKAAGYERVDDLIPHWEFSMDGEQIEAIEEWCRVRGKRSVMISSGDWNGFLSTLLFARLYEVNGIRPTGITFNNYWCCHPYYEARFGRLPIVAFEYGADVYVEEFRKLLESVDWAARNGEYLVWSEEFNRTRAMDPAARFESWGFPTRYRTDRPYDIWQFSWEDHDDPRNPTREWIVPQLRNLEPWSGLGSHLAVDDVIKIAREVRKTTVTIHE